MPSSSALGCGSGGPTVLRGRPFTPTFLNTLNNLSQPTKNRLILSKPRGMMPSNRIRASCANGSGSGGPITPQGKAYRRLGCACAIESKRLSSRKQTGPTEIDRMTETFRRSRLHNPQLLRHPEIPNELSKSLTLQENPNNEHPPEDAPPRPAPLPSPSARTGNRVLTPFPCEAPPAALPLPDYGAGDRT